MRDEGSRCPEGLWGDSALFESRVRLVFMGACPFPSFLRLSPWKMAWRWGIWVWTDGKWTQVEVDIFNQRQQALQLFGRIQMGMFIAYYMPGPVLNILHILSLLIFKTNWWHITIIISILHRRRLRCREMKLLVKVWTHAIHCWSQLFIIFEISALQNSSAQRGSTRWVVFELLDLNLQ